MVKKGKDKAGGSGSGTKEQDFGDNIVFTNSTKEPKKSRSGPSNSDRGRSDEASKEAAGPPKPTVKQIIGGASWTGKLPVNLLSEHCQKQKWDKPEYETVSIVDSSSHASPCQHRASNAASQHRNSEGFSCFVSLSMRNPKTQETTKLPSFKLAPTHKHLVVRPTALEAKHAAATYALFRVCSMKNLHTMLPPDYRALWKEFEALKREDVKAGKEWMYAADPFAKQKEMANAKAAAEKKAREAEAAREKAKNLPGAMGLIALSAASGGPSDGSSAGGVGGSRNFDPMKGWTNVPRIEMGRRMRSQIEDLLRRGTIWNPHGVVIPPDAARRITDDLARFGFRRSHAAEAVSLCKDREEALEWLLVHVPEDDLPPWALPEHYSAGVSVGATDLRREAAVKRLAEAGYAIDLCRKVFDAEKGDEGRAAETLQKMLLGGDDKSAAGDEDGQVAMGDLTWDDEMESLESVFGDRFRRPESDVCQVRIDSVVNGADGDMETYVQFRRTPHYPRQVILSVVARLPSYIKLSIIKRASAYVQHELADEPMKIYLVAEWVQDNINSIIESPGALRDIAAVASAASESEAAPRRQYRRSPRHPKPVNWTPDPKSKEAWLKRLENPEMKAMVASRQKLPAWNARDDVVAAVTNNQVVIISGETGSGKSTQAVQFILDDLYNRGLGASANLIVTQPRRISALGLADRVSEERCSRIGDEVGYSIRGESKTSRNTKITFVTAGVLLRRLQVSGGRPEDVVASVADLTHIVIDEVHERSLDTDFLLTILRDVLRHRKDLKLVLMSATLDATAIKDYFAAEGLTVGTVEISGRTFPVQDFFLEDIIDITGFTGSGGRGGRGGYRRDDYDDYGEDDDEDNDTSGSAFQASAAGKRTEPVAKIIGRLGGRISYPLLVATTQHVANSLSATGSKSSGGILIFLPGVAEINQACSLLRSSPIGSSLHVLPLHAALETREQRRVFQPPPPGKRKVVVATNVAETSITIDDIVAVIDSGRVKETSFDPATNMRRLAEIWASRAAAAQRRGRAGRVQQGVCYRLYTRKLHDDTMAARAEPEIRRVPLEQLCLSVRAMGMRDVAGFLARAPTPPDTLAVDSALTLLRRMACLDPNGSVDGGDELTALGARLAALPADLRCGKLMLHGAVFGCLDDCVSLAAILSGSRGSPFVAPQDKRDAARAARLRFSAGTTDGDLLTDLRAYKAWDAMVSRGESRQAVRRWCDENFLSAVALAEIKSTRDQLYQALAEIGVRPTPSAPSSQAGTTTSQTISNPALLRALTASAFAPQMARIQMPEKKFAASVSGAVELDPEARTIKYFTKDHGRVFVHPGSTLFDAQGFSASSSSSSGVDGGGGAGGGGTAAFLSYFTMISTSKVFVRELTRESIRFFDIIPRP